MILNSLNLCHVRILMKSISRETIKLIKDNIDIVQIIGEYLPSLKKQGNRWKGLCPFHNDKHPSFEVNPEFGIYKCWSCGETGDVYEFIKKFENVSFVEAIKILAKRAGISVEISDNDEGSKIFQKKESLFKFNQRIIKTFQYFLLDRNEGKNAFGYLSKRGINKQLIEIFKLGYIPRNTNLLFDLLKRNGFKEEFLIETGMFKKRENKLQMLFFDRVMFPIFSQNGECVGFGGRVINKEAKPKYINSPETLIYKKRNVLYGLNITKEYIRQEKKAYIVEGYMDVISCFNSGLKNIVAPCGTAITKEQIKLLARYATNIVLLLDNDEAGFKGAQRALIEAANIEQVSISVLILSDVNDPDEYFKIHSIEDFNREESNIIGGFDFFVMQNAKGIDISNIVVLIDLLNSIFDYIYLWENEVAQTLFIKRVSELLNISQATIAQEYLTFKNKKKLSKSFGSSKFVNKPIKKDNLQNSLSNNSIKSNNNDIIATDEIKREIYLLFLLLYLDDRKMIINATSLKEEYFQNNLSQKIFKLILTDEDSINNRISKKNFADFLDSKEIKDYIYGLIFKPDFKFVENQIILKNTIIDLITNLIKRYYKRIIEDLNKKIKYSEFYNDNDSIKLFQEDKTVYINEIIKLSKLEELKNNG